MITDLDLTKIVSGFRPGMLVEVESNWPGPGWKQNGRRDVGKLVLVIPAGEQPDKAKMTELWKWQRESGYKHGPATPSKPSIFTRLVLQKRPLFHVCVTLNSTVTNITVLPDPPQHLPVKRKPT